MRLCTSLAGGKRVVPKSSTILFLDRIVGPSIDDDTLYLDEEKLMPTVSS